MKQYLQLLIVLGLNCLLSSSIYYTAEYPNAAMHSTSAMTSCGSSLPCAAFTGFVSADEILQCFNNLPTSPRRIGRNKAYNLDDYYNKPIGNYTAELPNATMRFISVITSCGSSLPYPAFTGFVSADDNLSEGSNDLPAGPRRIGGSNMNNPEDDNENLDDIWKTPIGDIPWGMMLVCILIYMAIFHCKSNKYSRGRIVKAFGIYRR
jgi:hypothetical protein